MARCDLCFREKGQLVPAYSGINAQVCKACHYEIDRVMGFILHYEGIQTTLDNFKTPNNPPLPPQEPSSDSTKSKNRRSKHDDNTTILPDGAE